jgi:hypothetical protein
MLNDPQEMEYLGWVMFGAIPCFIVVALGLRFLIEFLMRRFARPMTPEEQEQDDVWRINGL